MLTIIAIICILAGLAMVGRYVQLRNEQKEKKGFLVLIGAILFIWFCPGIGLLLIGLLCLLAVLCGFGL